jgi:pSer/pThr/pTyr-binding forkhead associated (FHA) protein
MTKTAEMAFDTPAFTLNITSGPLAGKQIHSEGHRFRVGRTKASSIQIKDSAVSEKHAEIVWNDGEWQIRDLGSSNGTMHNGTEVKGKEFLLFEQQLVLLRRESRKNNGNRRCRLWPPLQGSL